MGLFHWAGYVSGKAFKFYVKPITYNIKVINSWADKSNRTHKRNNCNRPYCLATVTTSRRSYLLILQLTVDGRRLQSSGRYNACARQEALDLLLCLWVAKLFWKCHESIIRMMICKIHVWLPLIKILTCYSHYTDSCLSYFTSNSCGREAKAISFV
jgi:hypothetical protein